MGKSKKVKIKHQSQVFPLNVERLNDDRYIATWKHSGTHTSEYKYKWFYSVRHEDTKVYKWFESDEGTVNVHIGSDTASHTYNVEYSPGNGIADIYVRVKPVATKKKKKSSWYTGQWKKSNTLTIDSRDRVPDTSVPTATFLSYDNNFTNYELSSQPGQSDYMVVDEVEFFISCVGNSSLDTTVRSTVVNGICRVRLNLVNGNTYQVRARSWETSITQKDRGRGQWSEYSDFIYTAPSAPTNVVAAVDEDNNIEVNFSGYGMDSYTSYTVEYATKQTYFDSGGNTSTVSVDGYRAILSGLTQGSTYYIRIQTVFHEMKSVWSNIVTVVVGKKPSPPTTWTSTNTVIEGEELCFYWTHNAEDNSYARRSRIIIFDETMTTRIYDKTIENTRDVDHRNDVWELRDFNTNQRGNVTYKWYVQTKGVHKDWSDPSETRTFKIFVKPEVMLSSSYGLDDQIEFPLTLSAHVTAPSPGNNNQNPISYSYSIVYNGGGDEDTMPVDATGQTHFYYQGEVVWNKTIVTGEYEDVQSISAGDVMFMNDANYIFSVTTAFDSGLSATASFERTVLIDTSSIEPDVSMTLNEDDYTMLINPMAVEYIVDDETEEIEEEVPIENIEFDVYRIGFDGELIPIETGVPNEAGITIIDPHPSFGTVSYRIVSRDTVTGAMSFYDTPPEDVDVSSIVLQWNESVTSYSDDYNIDDELAESNYSGCKVVLPTNIDVSDKSGIDKSLVSYIGRKHPVSYYGTQVGQSATWNAEIDARETGIISMLRRLQVWTGDVYVREPSGVGYWATVSVTFPIKHMALTVSVTIEVTRVEGDA